MSSHSHSWSCFITAAAANELDTLRTNWLNPPEWTKTEVLEFPGSADGPWRRYLHDVDPANGIGTVRYPRIVPKNADCALKLKARTLTNLYNERPAWLAAVHDKLDAAAFAAYGWPTTLSDDELLARLLALNLSRAAPSPSQTDDILAELNFVLGTKWNDSEVPKPPKQGWEVAREVLEKWSKRAKTTLEQWSKKARELLDRWWEEKERKLRDPME